MKNKIKEVQDYFRNRILKGEFEITKYDDGVIGVNVDGFCFQLHVMKKYEVASLFYTNNLHFIKLEQFSASEKSELYKNIHPLVTGFIKKELDGLIQKENDRHEIELQKICDLDN